MTLKPRDKKIMLVIAPVVLVMAYWFLVLAPKREEASKLSERLEQVAGERDEAQSEATRLEHAKTTYAEDYEAVVQVGKAVPASLDMPSLIVQLDQAAKGTGIRFSRIKTGQRAEAPPPPPPAAGGESAESGPGESRETADGAADTSEQRSEDSGAAPAAGAAPTGSDPAAGAAGGGESSGVSGLDTVPLEFSFSGSFFDLADFFHRMKRFVRVANQRVKVEGRLITIDGFTFESTEFPTLKVDVQATVYLAPKTEGTAAGATPSGPQSTTPPAPGAAPSTPTPPAAPPAAPAPASGSGGVQ